MGYHHSIKGVENLSGGEYDSLKILGVCNNNGVLKVKDLEIEGVFNSKGDIQSETISCEGTAKISGCITAKKIDIEGIVRLGLHGEVGKLEAETLTCEGVISTEGDIYADNLTVQGCIKAKGIYGDKVNIESERFTAHFMGGFFKMFGFHMTTDTSNIELIEATEIYLSDARVDRVNGENVVIGPDCVIDTVDCTGTLKIHETSKVKNIIKN